MAVPFRNTDTNQVLLNFVQPHKPVSTTTFLRWCVAVMKETLLKSHFGMGVLL